VSSEQTTIIFKVFICGILEVTGFKNQRKKIWWAARHTDSIEAASNSRSGRAGDTGSSPFL